MFIKNKMFAIVLLASGISTLAYADSKVVYEMTKVSGEKTEYTVSLAGRWLRVDSIPKGKSDYVIMDTGRLLQFDVYGKTKTFQLTRMGRLYWPETPLTSPKFKLLRKQKAVSGMRCQPVNEVNQNRQPVAEHCMASGGVLKLNAREMITLSRLFMSTRRMSGKLENSLLGVATTDERQVSIQTQSPVGDKLEIKSVSHGWIDKNQFKVPKGYTQLKPDIPAPQNTPPSKFKKG